MTRRAGRIRGFTLLELIIAISIFALVSAMAYGGLNAVLRSANATREAEAKLEALQLAMAVLMQDFTQLTNRSVRDAYGDTRPALIGPDPQTGGFQFTRRGWPNPAEQPRGTLQRVIYRVEDGVLIRGYWLALDAAPNAEPVQMPLLEGVSSITLRYLGEESTWVDQWPPLTATPAPSKLPKAVELTLGTEHWGEIVRLIPIEEASDGS